MTRRIVALSALSWALCALLYVAQPAHAATPPANEGRTEDNRSVDRVAHLRSSILPAPDCTTQDKRDSTGIVITGNNAVITFTLTRDCAVSLWSYAEPGPNGALVDSAVASGIGTHTLTVRACAQVDFVPGPTHERGSGEAFTFEFYEEAQCEASTSTTTTVPVLTTTVPPVSSPTTTSTASSPPSTVTVAPSAPTCVPDCENPDAPEHPPALAYGGPDPVTDAVAFAFPFVLAAGLAFVVVGRAEG